MTTKAASSAVSNAFLLTKTRNLSHLVALSFSMAKWINNKVSRKTKRKLIKSGPIKNPLQKDGGGDSVYGKVGMGYFLR